MVCSQLFSEQNNTDIQSIHIATKNLPATSQVVNARIGDSGHQLAHIRLLHLNIYNEVSLW